MIKLNMSPRRVAAAAAGVAFGAGAALVAATPAQAVVVTYERIAEWGSGYAATVTVENDEPAPIGDWELTLVFPPDTVVNAAWNATVTTGPAGDRYVFGSLAWNGTIGVGERVQFGFTADGPSDPIGCLLNGDVCPGWPEPDVVPPSAPGDLRTEGAAEPGQMLVSWDAATDDRGVAGYELFLASPGDDPRTTDPLVTTTDTSHAVPVPPPAPFVLAVRAFDEAGNVSAFDVLPLGAVDEAPPTAPGTVGHTTGGAPDHVRLEWGAATDDLWVAGYEVRVNGELVGEVSGLGAHVPVSGYGVFTFEVRAFDGEGARSEPAVLALAIDPPPTLW